MEKDNIINSILLVDDEEDIINAFVPFFKKNGYAVTAFTDPRLALSHFKGNHTRFRALLSDVRMPGMSGFELVKNVKQINPRLKAILMTAFEIHPMTLDKLKDDSQADLVVTKPVRPSQIVEILRNL